MAINKARKSKNHINISIVGLTEEPMLLHRAKNYKTVCEETEEGVFVNIVKKDGNNCQKVLNNLATITAVYKKDKQPIITELSDSAL